jgi:hypothetical protein
MLLDDDDNREMIAAIGDDTTARFGTAELAVVFNPDGQIRLVGEMLERSGPYAVAPAADVAALELVGGNDGDVLEIGGIEYQILAIDPDGSGAALLSLLEVS